MPRIFDNIDQQLLPALRQALGVSQAADFCVGYFNLRGWKSIDDCIDKWSGQDGNACRLLVGMQRAPSDEFREAMALGHGHEGLDAQTAARLRKQLAQEFRDQLTLGAPTNEDERALQRLASQLREKKVVVKLFLRHALHAKLYLMHRSDEVNPKGVQPDDRQCRGGCGELMRIDPHSHAPVSIHMGVDVYRKVPFAIHIRRGRASK